MLWVMPCDLSPVCLPDMVYGTRVVQRLYSNLPASDPAVFLEAPGCHGQRRQRSEF